MQATKVLEANIENLDMVSKENEHPMNKIVVPLSGRPIGSSENKSIVTVVLQEDLSIEVPHIDFIFGDEQYMIKVCSRTVRILQLEQLLVRSRFHGKFGQQKKQRLKSSWSKRLSELSTNMKRMSINKRIESSRNWSSTQEDIYGIQGRVISKRGRTDVGQIHTWPAHWA